MDMKIMGAKVKQEQLQEQIDEWKQRLQNTSQEQDKGRTGTSCFERTCGYSN